MIDWRERGALIYVASPYSQVVNSFVLGAEQATAAIRQIICEEWQDAAFGEVNAETLTAKILDRIDQNKSS